MSGPRDDGTDDDAAGFLGRWSRRKQAARTQPVSEAPASDPVETPAAEAVQGETAVMAPDASATSATLAEAEELVIPPSLDEIGADFDLAPWLNRNVPEAWKLAAMRRAWSNDPAIRDFKGLADYDLDYNTPGMAPGYGPLSESDDVKAMVRQIFGEPEPVADSDPVIAHAGDAITTKDMSRAEDQSSAEPELAASQQRPDEDESASGDTIGQNAANEAALPMSAVRMPGAPPVTASAALPQKAPVKPSEQEPPVRIYKRRGGAIPV